MCGIFMFISIKFVICLCRLSSDKLLHWDDHDQNRIHLDPGSVLGKSRSRSRIERCGCENGGTVASDGHRPEDGYYCYTCSSN